jgi:hypothetical protein
MVELRQGRARASLRRHRLRAVMGCLWGTDRYFSFDRYPRAASGQGDCHLRATRSPRTRRHRPETATKYHIFVAGRELSITCAGTPNCRRSKGARVVQGQARSTSETQQTPHAAVEEGLRVPRQAESTPGGFIEIAVPAAAVMIGLVLLAGPFLSTLLRSVIVAPETGPSVFALSNFLDLIKDRAFFDAVSNTIISGAGATLFSGILGFSLAWIVSRTDIPGRNWFEVLNLVPFFYRRTSAL